MFVKISTRPIALFGRFCRNDSPLLTYKIHVCSQVVPSYTLNCPVESFSTIDDLRNFWRIKFQEINTDTFCSWDDIFTQYLKLFSTNNLSKCTESTSTLSTITSFNIESLLVLKQPSCNVFFVKNDCWKLFRTSKQVD